MREHESRQDRHHERIRRTVLKEAVYPSLKSAVQREPRPEDLVLGEDQEEDPDGDP